MVRGPPSLLNARAAAVECGGEPAQRERSDQQPEVAQGEDVERLLGPEGEEVSCERCFELIDEYAEAEAVGADPAADMPGMRAHLEGCPACREDLESLVALIVSDEGRTG